MKKILIAGFFATIMFLVPLSSVVASQEGGVIESKQELEQADPITIEQLFDDLEILMNEIIQELSDYPEVVAICYDILDIINSYDLRSYPIICNILDNIAINLWELSQSLVEIIETNPDNLLLLLTLTPIVITVVYLFLAFVAISVFVFNCDDNPSLQFENEFISNLQMNLDLIQGQTVECPCGE